MTNNFFSTHHLNKYFGGIQALDSLDFQINEGEIHGIIGPNGAGKTTLINVISGLEKPSSGEISFLGNRIDQLSPEAIFERGISRTFQDGKIVSNLTVLENISIGLSIQRYKKSENDNIFKKIITQFIQIKHIEERSKEVLKEFGIESLAYHWGDDLVWFERQLVQIARSIVSKPVFLLLDEPTAGLGISEKEMIENKLKEINQTGVTIMLISHDMEFIQKIAQEITVLDFGKKIGEGSYKQIFNDSKVWEAYFGTEYK